MRALLVLLCLVSVCTAQGKLDPSKWPGCIGAWNAHTSQLTDNSLSANDGTNYTPIRVAVNAGSYFAGYTTTSTNVIVLKNKNALIAVSVSVWVKTSTTAIQGPITCYNCASFPGFALFVNYPTATKWGFFVGTAWGTGSTKVINNGAWHHLAATAAANVTTYYVDGVLDTTEAATINFSSGMYSNHIINVGAFIVTPPTVANDNCGQISPTENMDELYLFDRAITAFEVSQLYNAYHP